MGRLVYIPFALTTTTTCDFLELTPADDKPCRIRGFCIGQKTEIAEAQEEILDIRLTRMTATVTSGSGGGAGAPFAPDTGDTASFTATTEVNNTTIATTSGATHELRYPWQLRNSPFVEWFPDERFGLKAKQTEYLFLRLATAPADSVDIYGWVCVEEE